MALQRRVHRRAREKRFHGRQAVWTDPYPQIPGTLPEKMLFAALVANHIYFVFQGPLPDTKTGATLDLPGFEPDILLPEYRVIIDPFGEFAHTQPDSIQRDYFKTIVYTSAGFAFYHPWASQITKNGGLGASIFLSTIRELAWGPRYKLSPEDQRAKDTVGYRLGKNLGAGATGTAAGNKARAARRLPSATKARSQRLRR